MIKKEEFAEQLEQAVITDDYHTLEELAEQMSSINRDDALWVKGLAMVAYQNCWGYDQKEDERVAESYVA